eukprot:CAMPEP_0115051446 /NCGR_PEP_ID=MMETSP0227-20121206/2350_1 /TAXON_ID=89957 /ORGANISM="Polarella glacialis, Strain CCMP 1383" /LENGTH=349 /DNA_ID=CAMNT_0002435425 /DNA_START=611 /DNA_END=1662 /DNA_ORIENTATION=+
MRKEADQVPTSVDAGAATAATTTQWDTVLFWVICSTFVGLVSMASKHLLNVIRGVKYDESLLPVWVIQPSQQQPFLAQLQQDRGTRQLFASGPPGLQQNPSVFAAGPAQLDPTPRPFASQVEWSPLGYLPPQSFPTGMDTATRAPGFSQAELERLASDERWIALPASYKRAAGVYHLIRSAGHGTVRRWFAATWGDASESQQRRDLYHSATLCDMRIDEYLTTHGVAGLMWALTHDDMLEGLFRQLSAAREFQLTGDAAAASRILAFRNANGSVLPSWLQCEARRWSEQVHEQGRRLFGQRWSAGRRLPQPKENSKARASGMKTETQQMVRYADKVAFGGSFRANSGPG